MVAAPLRHIVEEQRKLAKLMADWAEQHRKLAEQLAVSAEHLRQLSTQGAALADPILAVAERFSDVSESCVGVLRPAP